jgi:DNA-directed RNA polymerase specialized sigma24 family protein
MTHAPSDVRYLDPKTLEVMSTETVDAFRDRCGRIAETAEHVFIEMVEEHKVREAPVKENQLYYAMLNDAVDHMKEYDKPMRDILRGIFIDGMTIAEAAVTYDKSPGYVRLMIHRFRQTAKERFCP